ncbi:MAG: hypothetical protein M1830_003546, partial [Pleopsidium flavum]
MDSLTTVTKIHPRPDWSVPQPTQKWYTEEVSGRTREYSGLRRDIQRRDTETRYVERLGDKTRVITQSQKHAPTIQPAGTFITPQLRHSAPNALYTRERPLPASQPCVEIRNAVPEYIIYNDESSHEDSVSDAGSDVSFTFDLSFHKTRPKEDDHGVTISGSSDKSGNREPEKATSSVENKPNSYNETPYRVLRSRYNGDIYARGDTVAELTTEPNQESSKRVPLPLLRWIHLESQYPSLASFLEYVLRTHRLDEDERQDAIALLERTRETYEKPILTPEGTKGKYLEPHFAEENVYNRRLKVKKERSAQLLCIPYFCLAPYLTHSLSHASQLHPMRTLLQSSYSSAPKKRDLQQAEFTANFKDLSIEFDDDYEVVYKGIVRRVDDWVAVIAQAKETTIYLSLRNKRKSRIIYNSPFGSEAEDEESASVSSTNSDSRNNSSEIPGHNSAGKDGSKPSSKSFSDPTAYDDESSIWSQQDNTSPARNTPRTKPPGAPKPGSTPTNSRSKIQASLNNFHLFLWLTAVSEKADSPEVNAGNGSKSDIDVKSMRHTDSIGRSFDVNTDRLDNLFSDMQRFIYSAKFKKRRAYKRCPSHTLQE